MRLVRRLSNLAAAALVTFVLVAGCKSGPAVGQVTGKVTFKGTPVTEGKITFYEPKTGQAVEGDLDKDGGYTIRDVRVGEYIVTIRPLTILIDSDPGKTPPAPEYKPAPNIPLRYRGDTTSPLKANITEGS